MTPKQKQILNDAIKKQIKNEKVLSGGGQYTNPSKKGKKPTKKSWIEKLFN